MKKRLVGLYLLCAVYQRIGKPEKTTRRRRGQAAAGGVNYWMLILAGRQHAARGAWPVLCSKSGSPPATDCGPAVKEVLSLGVRLAVMGKTV